MTTALYRRYRPDTFDQVIGQDHVTEPLKAALRANKVTHAYLFSGPRGCGKTTSARILARCLNCAQGPTDTPCGRCDSCRELATGGSGSLDVVEIDAASHGGVDDARDLRERATFAPVRDRYKVFIIDEAHMVTNQGFNALLKLVEEPPEHVKFVFATTEPERVIGTIRSRTHHYPFRLVPPDVLEPYLCGLCDEEGVRVGDGVLGLVMRAGTGSVRDTLSVLDQLMAGSVDGEITYQTAVALLGYTDNALLDESIDALAGGDGAAAYRVVERMVESGHDLRRFVEDLLQRLRDLLIIAVAGDGAAEVLSGTPVDQFERMQHQARNWGPRGLSRAADLTDEALRSMTGATSPRLQLELLIGRILVPSTSVAAPQEQGGIENAPMPGTVGMTGGGAPAEAPVGARFGAREAREAFTRHREGRAPAGQATQQAPAAIPDARETSAPPGAPPAPERTAEPSPDESRAGRRPSDGAGDIRTAEAQNSPAEGAAEPPTAPTESESGDGVVSGRDADMVRGRWNEVVERLSSISRVTWSLVGGNAQLGAVDGSQAVLLFPIEHMAMNFTRGNRAGDVERAILEVTGLTLQVVVQVGQASGGAAVTGPSAAAAQPPAQEWVSEPPPFDEAAPVAEPAPAEPDVQWTESVEQPASREEAPAPMEPGVEQNPDADAAGGPRVATTPDAEIDGWPEVRVPAPEHAPRRGFSVFTYPGDEDEAPAPPAEQTTSASGDAPSSVAAEPAAPSQAVPVFDDAPVAPESTHQTDEAPASSEEPAPAVSTWSEAVAVPGGQSDVTFDADEHEAASEAPQNRRQMRSPGRLAAMEALRESRDAPDVAEPRPAIIDDDTASIDDEDIENSAFFGLPAVLEILGGKVIEEKLDEGGR